MAYRLAIIPAGVAASAADAADLIEEMCTAPRGSPSAVIADLLGTLEGSPVAGNFTVARRPCAHGLFLTAATPESGLLEALLLLTKDRYLAVYDLALHRLYDPTDRLDVEVALPGVRLPYLNRELLRHLVNHPEWPHPEAPYLTVDHADQDYIQTWRRDDGVYQLEHREGGPESHFEARITDPDTVVEVIWLWATGDPKWRTAVEWEFLDFDRLKEIS